MRNEGVNVSKCAEQNLAHGPRSASVRHYRQSRRCCQDFCVLEQTLPPPSVASVIKSNFGFPFYQNNKIKPPSATIKIKE